MMFGGADTRQFRDPTDEELEAVTLEGVIKTTRGLMHAGKGATRVASGSTFPRIAWLCAASGACHVDAIEYSAERCTHMPSVVVVPYCA